MMRRAPLAQHDAVFDDDLVWALVLGATAECIVGLVFDDFTVAGSVCHQPPLSFFLNISGAFVEGFLVAIEALRLSSHQRHLSALFRGSFLGVWTSLAGTVRARTHARIFNESIVLDSSVYTYTQQACCSDRRLNLSMHYPMKCVLTCPRSVRNSCMHACVHSGVRCTWPRSWRAGGRTAGSSPRTIRNTRNNLHTAVQLPLSYFPKAK